MSLSNWEQETKLPLVTSCKQAARLVSLAFERRLTLREFAVMKLHLVTCKTCSFYRRQIAVLRRTFVRHEEMIDHVPPAEGDCLSPSARRRVNDALAGHGR